MWTVEEIQPVTLGPFCFFLFFFFFNLDNLYYDRCTIFPRLPAGINYTVASLLRGILTDFLAKVRVLSEIFTFEILLVRKKFLHPRHKIADVSLHLIL